MPSQPSLPGLCSVILLLTALIGCGSPVARQDSRADVRTPKTPQEAAKKSPGRVAVEHGIDVDVSKIDRDPRVVTVEELLATRDKGTAKIDLAAYHDRRVAPFETTTFEVKGKIKGIVHEKDGDFYFVLQGKTGAEAVIEVPDPKLCTGSPLLSSITDTRVALEKRYHPDSKYRDLDEEVTVDGVGFLGSRRKKGSGSFGSSVRLMPGTGVKFAN